MQRPELVAYHDGDIVPESELAIPIDDPGFRWGYNIYDLLVTFDHEPYQLDEHVDRALRSCRAARIPIDLTHDELSAVTRDLIGRNTDAIGDDEDFLVFISVSGGWSVYRGRATTPRVIVSVTPTPFERMAPDFIDGRHLITSSVRQLSNDSISPRIKHRSRMHFVLADIEAKQVDENADPLLLDDDGNVTETTIGNVFVVDEGVLRTPPVNDVLPGVTRETTLELARESDIPVAVEELQLYDVYNADEAFWANTSHVIAPITTVDGQPIGEGRPGPVTEKLLDAHSEHAGIDIVERFLSHLPPDERPDQLRLGGDGGIS